jgi:hypothetical protein
MADPNFAERLDVAIANFFATWNVWTTLLVLALTIFLVYPLIVGSDPDLHPFLLARQSQAAPIRQPGESAVYRAVDIPHGYPLRTGLGVKDPGTPKWSAGRPGDLRDTWRAATRGAVNDAGEPTGQKGKILTILGREKVIEHDFDKLTLGMNVLGQFVKRNNGQSVAVCLSNSVELLSAVFCKSTRSRVTVSTNLVSAGAFYGFSTILLPYGLPPDKLNSLLANTGADHVIAEAGALDLDSLSSSVKSVKTIIWVTLASNEHMDWSAESPDGFNVTSWHDLVEKTSRTANSEVLPLDKDSQVPPVSIFVPGNNGSFDLVKYTSEARLSLVVVLSCHN